jgi:hypothetical protein
MQAVAFSGGKDSTAMAYRLAEHGEDFVLLHTPTGNELPALAAHIQAVAAALERELVYPPTRPLAFWIDYHGALPNWRQRWCTRQIKIEPCIAWLVAHPGTTLCVGLRADEETRVGLYGDWATYRYPLRDEGWDEARVWAYLRARGVTVPARTDCAVCFGQRLGEWWELWKTHPDQFAQGEAWEAETGHTFRSPGRDQWPAALTDLRARFERGDVPPGVELNGDLFEDTGHICRVCSL